MSALPSQGYEDSDSPCESELIIKFPRVHSLCNAFTNSGPVTSVEMLSLIIKNQQRFVSVCIFKECDLVPVYFSDMETGIRCTEKARDLSFGVIAWNVAMGLEGTGYVQHGVREHSDELCDTDRKTSAPSAFVAARRAFVSNMIHTVLVLPRQARLLKEDK